MSDNVQLNVGTGGDVAAADDIGGVKYQRLKLTLGADGANDGDVSSTNPMPVSAASLPLPSGAATEATLDARTGSLTETAPASDTASSGLNGRLQRIAQRLTSLIALLPAALGAGGGLKVDGSGTALPVSQSGTFTVQPGNTANTTAWLVKGVGAPAVDYDTIIGPTQASTTDTYVKKTGGASGTTVQTITVTFTDSTKTVLSKVEYT